jgi:hypothetical protein
MLIQSTVLIKNDAHTHWAHKTFRKIMRTKEKRHLSKINLVESNNENLSHVVFSRTTLSQTFFGWMDDRFLARWSSIGWDISENSWLFKSLVGQYSPDNLHLGNSESNII